MKFVIWACQHHHKIHAIPAFQLAISYMENSYLNLLTPSHNGYNFANGIFINRGHLQNSLYKNCIYIQIVQNFIPNGPVDNKLSMGLIMDCHRTDDKPLSEPMMAFLTDT